LLDHLNPIIRGWSAYYSSQCSKAYSHLDFLLYQKLRAWAKRRHQTKPDIGLLVVVVGQSWWGWVFASKQGNKLLQLVP